MNRRNLPLGTCYLLVMGVCTSAVVAAEGPVDRFLAGLDSTAATPAEARQMLREKWSQCDDCDPAEFLTQALAVMSPKFREGLDAYDADEYERCAKLMSDLRSDADPFVAVHAAVYEIKSLVALEQLVEAGQRIRQLAEGGGTRVDGALIR